jgi:hypothetical protein
MGGDDKPTAGDLNLQRKQGCAGAGSPRAFTRLRVVKGAMASASQKLAIVAEKLIRPPIKRRAGVDTIVDVGVIASLKIYDKGFDQPPSPEDVKFHRFARRNFGNRCRPFRGVSRVARTLVLFHDKEEKRPGPKVFAPSKPAGAERRLC